MSECINELIKKIVYGKRKYNAALHLGNTEQSNNNTYLPVIKDFWDTETLILKWFNQNKEFMILFTVLQTLINNNETVQNLNSRRFLHLHAEDREMIIGPKGKMNETIQSILENSRKNKIDFNVIQIQRD